MNWQAIAQDLIAPLTTGAIGYGSAAVAFRKREHTTRRESAAGAVLPRLEELRRLVRIAHVHAEGAEWLDATADALEALDDVRYRLPEPWRHLQQSIRIAIGEVSGAVAFAERYPRGSQVQLARHCPTWSGHAEAYLSYAIDALREWRDDLRRWKGRPLQLLAFDPWLERSGRAGLSCDCRSAADSLDPMCTCTDARATAPSGAE